MNNLDLEIQNLDEERQLRNLTNAIKLGDDFSLLFVRCNQRPRQKEIIEELKGKLAGCNIKIIFLDHQIEHLLDELQNQVGDNQYDAIFVYGLESSFPKADEAAESPFVVTLNHARNSFKKVLNCPLVLFLPEYALSAIYHGATDFYSIRSGIYLFSVKAEETEQLVSSNILLDYKELQGLLYEERQSRIQSTKELLAEYQSLPQSQRNFEKESVLKERIADLHSISGEYESAVNIYQQLIKEAKVSENLVALGRNLNALGIVLDAQQKYYSATELYKDALDIYRNSIGMNHPIYATSLNNLAANNIYQKKYKEAAKLCREALKIYRNTIGKNNYDYARTLSNLGSAYARQGRYDEAIKLYEESLEIDSTIANDKHLNYAVVLNNLAGVYFHQGKYQKALPIYDKSYQLYIKLLGSDHNSTVRLKKDIEINKRKAKEQVSRLIPYKN